MKREKEPYDQLGLLEYFKRFPDEDACWRELVRLRWPRGKKCPGCGQPMGFIQTRRLFQCNRCRTQVSATAGTIFHLSHTPLQKWFWAIFLMGTSPKGVSARYVQKQLGIKNYRTAWLMGHKIRQAMLQREGLYKLKGKVQVDEVVVGRQSMENRLKIRKETRSRFLMAIQEGQRGDPRFVTFEELMSYFKEGLLEPIEKRIEKGSTLKSDGNPSYTGAREKGYHLEPVAFEREPDKAKEHLKWIHWLSSNLKRGLVSTYHGCFPKYRKAYLAEFAYRFNRRHWPRQSFDRLLIACIQGYHAPLKEITK
jgi:hypothetical protein